MFPFGRIPSGKLKHNKGFFGNVNNYSKCFLKNVNTLRFGRQRVCKNVNCCAETSIDFQLFLFVSTIVFRSFFFIFHSCMEGPTTSRKVMPTGVLFI